MCIRDSGRCVQNSKLMYEAMRYAAQFNALLILHEEEQSFSENGLVNEGYYSSVLGLDGISCLSEDLMVSRDISVSYTHLRAHETVLDLVCRLLLEKKK